MKKKIFICNFDLEIGGVERSLIGLMNAFDYKKYDVDLFLLNHKGEFYKMINPCVNLLPEISTYTTFRKSILKNLLEGKLIFSLIRLFSKIISKKKSTRLIDNAGNSYLVRTIKYSIPFLKKFDDCYDIAISFLTPHYIVAKNVNAKVKVAFVHTDYTVIDVEKKLELPMWQYFNHIAAVSEECRNAFIRIFPELKDKCTVIENILSTEFVKNQAEEYIPEEYLEERGIKVCTVGRFTTQKAFDLAIIACRKLLAKGYNIKWYAVGYGGDESLMRKLIEEHSIENNFIIIGKKTNPYPYIKGCDIYCQPSRYEGKAVTVREAQMLGKPVVITNFATAKSQLDDGVDGYICPLGVDGIVSGIERLIVDVGFRNQIANNTSLRDYGNVGEVEKIYKWFF